MGTELHNLQPPEGARKKKKRLGRGPGSGTGKTSGRGMKGQRARNTVRAQFEGGQNPIHRRVPKRGFVNIHRVEVHGVNLSRLEKVCSDGDVVDLEYMRAKSLVPKRATVIKLLADGEITKKLTVKVHRTSASAQSKLEAAGGKVELIAPEAPAADAE